MTKENEPEKDIKKKVVGMGLSSLVFSVIKRVSLTQKYLRIERQLGSTSLVPNALLN